MAQGSRRPVIVHRFRGLLGRYYLGIPIHRVPPHALLMVITSFPPVFTGRPPGQSLPRLWPAFCRATSCGMTRQLPMRQTPDFLWGNLIWVNPLQNDLLRHALLRHNHLWEDILRD